MRKECTLVATIPALSNMIKVNKVITEPNVAELRFNTGSRSPFSPKETIRRLLWLAKQNNKKLWIDIKGRQLRVNAWADPLYECVTLNHTIKVDLPAKMVFRSGYSSEISHIDGNFVFLSEPPREALGKGQSVNIFGDNLIITDGYLTNLDKEYLRAIKELCIDKDLKDDKFSIEDVHIMASYVETQEDLNAICNALGIENIQDIECCSKIESIKGLDLVCSGYFGNFVNSRIMAARDDLYTELRHEYSKMKEALILIHHFDSSSICASRIFTSLENNPIPALSEYEDLEIMYQIGYRYFMLSDGVCNYAFDRAIKAWEEFINA